jgi:hypothetical protein
VNHPEDVLAELDFYSARMAQRKEEEEGDIEAHLVSPSMIADNNKR